MEPLVFFLQNKEKLLSNWKLEERGGERYKILAIPRKYAKTIFCLTSNIR